MEPRRITTTASLQTETMTKHGTTSRKHAQSPFNKKGKSLWWTRYRKDFGWLLQKYRFERLKDAGGVVEKVGRKINI